LAKAAGVILFVFGILLTIVGIILAASGIVYEPTLDGDPCSEFETNEYNGQVTQNGVNLDSGDSVHVYGRVTEMEIANPFPTMSSTHTSLALAHQVVVMIPNSIVPSGMENGDYISVKGHIRDYMTVEYIEADSVVLEEGYAVEICVAGCGIGFVGIILIIIGIVVMARAGRRQVQAVGPPTPPAYLNNPFEQQQPQPGYTQYQQQQPSYGQYPQQQTGWGQSSQQQTGYGQYPQQQRSQQFMYDERKRGY
jgi:uncharacterized membrane protein